MSNATFDVVVSGVARGHHPRKVRQNLVHLLKDDSSKLDILLTGKSVAVLRGSDQATAVRYATALENAGLSCELTSTADDREMGPKSIGALTAHGSGTQKGSRGKRHRPCPVWIKLACAFSILLVGFSFYRNAGFYVGYSQGRKAVAAEEQGDHESAARLFASAAKQVPESQELAALAALYDGLQFLSNQQLRQALPQLKKYDHYDSQNPQLKSLILTVESALAFDEQDFDRYYGLQKQSLAASPQDPMKLAAVASALACKFAVSGDEAARNECVQYLERAEKFAGPDRGRFEFHRQRILHRLDSREIISPAEFAQRYPRGYRKGR